MRALRTTIALLLITGVIYPLAMTGFAQLVLKDKANGSLVTENGAIVGSKLIGQLWTGPEWFHGRPSAITTTDSKGNSVADPYDATTSGGSNLGPLSQDLETAIAQRAAAIINEDGPYNPGLKTVDQIPSDLLLASASGLDPDISVAAAEFQVPRIAAVRKRPQSEIENIVRAHVHGPPANFFGQRYVSVLELNLAL
ncbi:MAG: potassium-transporting ATPase subunit KdpC [Actinomycetota bacterium]